MSDPHDKDKKPAAEEAAGAPKAAKGGMLVPLIAAAIISVGGSFGVGFFLNKQLLTGINKELTLALAQVGASEDHGDAHGAAKDPKAASGAHGADAGHGKPSKEAAHSSASDHGPDPKKADAAAAHDAPKPKADPHGAPAKKETPEEIAKAAQVKAGLFPLGADPIVANPSGDTRFVVVKVTLLSVGQADISAQVEANIDRLRDAVSAFLADQRIDDMQKRGFRSQMSAQLALAFNRILGPGTVKEIIFPQFVIQ
ncbi:MAG: flagellar basal body-associated FliL family protein [Verrucomicrobia bacterium]|nr:flagellar basal body-associated FliL family protein [Verrucomicrobiota bacterium]